MEPDPRGEELGMKSLPSSCKDAWGKQIPPEPPPFNMSSWIGERSHQSEITMVEQEPKGGENVNDPSTILDNPSSTETPISSEQEHQLILLEPDPIREVTFDGLLVLSSLAKSSLCGSFRCFLPFVPPPFFVASSVTSIVS